MDFCRTQKMTYFLTLSQTCSHATTTAPALQTDLASSRPRWQTAMPQARTSTKRVDMAKSILTTTCTDTAAHPPATPLLERPLQPPATSPLATLPRAPQHPRPMTKNLRNPTLAPAPQPVQLRQKTLVLPALLFQQVLQHSSVSLLSCRRHATFGVWIASLLGGSIVGRCKEGEMLGIESDTATMILCIGYELSLVAQIRYEYLSTSIGTFTSSRMASKIVSFPSSPL